MANLLTLLTLLSWIPFTAALFVWLSATRALSIAYVAGWVLLPCAIYDLPGMPNFGKSTAILLGCLLGLALSKDSIRLLSTFRISWIDLPAFLLCLGTVATSLLNGLGIWDGVAGAVVQLCMWSGPYLLARFVIRSVDDLKKVAETIFWGGVCYIPFCLFEIRMSPQLHMMFYGFSPRGAWGDIRFGGYRPSVFMECGLELGMWMTATCLAGFLLWHQGKYQRIASIPVSLLLVVLLATTVLCKSTGALALLIIGLGCWIACRSLRSAKPMTLLVLSTLVYISVRASGLYDGSAAVDFVSEYINEERAGSLQFRLENEDLLGSKAFEKPLFGWGGWGRSRVYNEEGIDISVTDGRWIVIFGQLGVIGLLGTYGTLLLPCLAAIRRYGDQLCDSEAAAPIAALITIVAVFTIDTLLNDFPNPVYLLSAGAIGSLAQLAPNLAVQGGVSAKATVPWPKLERHCWPPPSGEHRAKSEV